MKRHDALAALRHYLPEIRSNFGVRRVSLLGSTAREEGREDTDLDLLVDFEVEPTFDFFMGLNLFPEDQIGHRVDMVTPGALKPRLRHIVEREAEDVA